MLESLVGEWPEFAQEVLFQYAQLVQSGAVALALAFALMLDCLRRNK